MRKFGLCLFYGLCVFTIAFSLFWMALPRLPLPEAPADETPPISGSVSSLVQPAGAAGPAGGPGRVIFLSFFQFLLTLMH